MSYLEETLLPLVLTIEPKNTESFILQALGMGDKNSQQSILIAFGDRIEKFWNQVFSDLKSNLIEETNKVKVGNRNRQVDHFFTANNGLKVYMESKCNLNFDTEKVRASNEKVAQVAEALGADRGVYFVPVLKVIPQEISDTYRKENCEIYGGEDLLSMINAPFTVKEYFNFLEEVVAPILEEKGL